MKNVILGDSRLQLTGVRCAEDQYSHVRFVRSALRAYALFACVLVLFSRVPLQSHHLFLVRVLQDLLHSIECVTHILVWMSPHAVSYPGWPPSCPVDSVVLTVPVWRFSQTQSCFRCLLHSAVALVTKVFFFLSCVATLVLTQTLLIFAALLRPVLGSAGLAHRCPLGCIRRMYKTSADAQGLLWLRCWRKLYWRNSHHAPLEVPLCCCHSSGPGYQACAQCAHQVLFAQESTGMDAVLTVVVIHRPPLAKVSLSMCSCSHSALPGLLVRAGYFDGSLPFFLTC